MRQIFSGTTYSEVTGAMLIGFFSKVLSGQTRLPKRASVYGWDRRSERSDHFPEVVILENTLKVKGRSVSFTGTPLAKGRPCPGVVFYWDEEVTTVLEPQTERAYRIERIRWNKG